MWNLSSPTMDWTRIPCIRMRSLNHWTTREVPKNIYYITTNLIKKVFKSWEVIKLPVEDTSFPILIFSLNLEFYLWQQTLPVVFLEATGFLCSFSRKYLPSTQVWITTVCLSVASSSKNGVTFKNYKWIVQFSTQTVAQVLLFRTRVIPQCAQVLYAYFLVLYTCY